MILGSFLGVGPTLKLKTFPHNLAFCRVVLATSTNMLNQTYLYDD